MRAKKSISKPSITIDKSQYAEVELQDKLTLWMLRGLIKLGGFKEFTQHNSFRNDDVAYFLDLGSFVDVDRDAFDTDAIFTLLKAKLSKLEARKRFTTNVTLQKNIKRFSELMELNSYEEQIFEFVVIAHQYEILEECLGYLGNDLNSNQAKRALAHVLNIPQDAVTKAFESGSKFSKSSLITIDKSTTRRLQSKFDIVNSAFADDMLSLDEDLDLMLRDVIRSSEAPLLNLTHYSHMQNDIDIVLPYLKKALLEKSHGVNILLYGIPGTGKTELVKTLAKELDVKLSEISYANGNDEAIDGKERLKSYKIAQSLLANKNTLLMYDEAEDIFESSGSFFMPQRQKDKAWINKMLETNPIPTIWITNNIYSIDNAIVRRFDMAIEVPIPKKQKREEIIKQYSSDLLDTQTITKLAQHENIAPALISRTAKVVSSLDTKESAKAFEHILNNTLKAQGYDEIRGFSSLALPNSYDPAFINCDMDLTHLTEGIKQHQNARLCIYGAPGTGKSAYGKYIAEVLDKPLMLKKGSDLIDKYVGGTEKNIARAFEEAKQEGAVLVFDEVDSFLMDRAEAKQSWEISQVNEMLVQMENFDGIFIATTNLMENLDKASLRRFDMKMEFDYLKAQQAWDIFVAYAKELKLVKPSISFRNSVVSLKYLTPGDFAAIVRQNRFRPLVDIKDLINRLKEEIAVKTHNRGNVMGFL